jgi:tRNA threonylcarbamoyladenosine biosynthesis protein TsaE
MKEPFLVQEHELKDLASRIIETLTKRPSDKGLVLFLDGDLGAGKTTFVKELGEYLGADKNAIHSPTFILKKEYKTSHPTIRRLVHVDAYRFDTKEESKVLRLSEDVEDKNALVVIEWPSKLGGSLEEDMTLQFSVVNDTTREVMIHYIPSVSSRF